MSLTLRRRSARAAGSVLALTLLVTASPVLMDDRPVDAKPKDRTAGLLVIGHRGASGYRPEHTLAAYGLAIEMGADFIEPDLVSTRDRVLVARHENEISGTTDVADRPEFADRRTTKTIDGVSYTGWFTEDFDLAELRTLRAKERIADVRQENTLYDGRYQVPTLDEVLDLARRASAVHRRTIGVYPETKHPTYHDSIGKSLEEPLLASLERFGYRSAKDPVFVQSFEVRNLQELSTRTGVRLVQLIGGSGRPADGAVAGYDQMVTAAGLRDIATYADGVGPNKERVIPPSTWPQPRPTALVADAHAVGLLVHPYTFRNESRYLPPSLKRGNGETDYGNAFAEYRAFFEAGVDGVFSDNPDTARMARDELIATAPAA